MSVENIFFTPVSQLCHRDVVTCEQEAPLVEIAATMRAHNISSVVIHADGKPVGMVTDRDLRNKVVAEGLNPREHQARDIMNSPLVTIREDDYLFEALYLMGRRRIHRLCVVDAEGTLRGILTDSDALRLQSRSPQQLMKEIEEAESPEDLKTLRDKMERLVVHLTGTGVATTDLVQTVALLNDRLLIRLIELIRAARYPDLTDRFAFLVLGSEGRREQTLATDQDNAIVHADDLSADELDQLRAFSVDLIDSLIGIGVPACTGGIMAKNEDWRRGLGAWKKVLDKWLQTPTPANILSGSMFFDLRTLHGDERFEQELKTHIINRLRGNSLFLVHSAANAVGFKPPLGLFGQLKPERSGPNRGCIEIKKAGIFAITEGIKAMALQAGIQDGRTRDRLLGLQKAGILEPGQTANLIAAFDFLVRLRLRAQLLSLDQGVSPSNYLPLDRLNRIEEGRLRLALEEVKNFQGFLRGRFHLHQVSR
ncbi:putative nucleotidyltransferase substrate binding domain-containing protein [Thiocystis violacea]|uniref:putative nucleotidyltransferase substrate binding domain-containing protein n=1 Tax=Thiocystis violacea TaxID=13725 RepID=UPI001905E9BF|nr:putative nucleotidyltransferase substrate binding domain-containing protein [Thiocystis violacea]MBK1716520.1 signal transduction protein [Thiocystis violacea]